MGKWLRAAFLIALLVGAGYFFGTVSRQIHRVHEMMMLSAFWDLLRLLLQLLLALGAVLESAGLVAALLRPVWVGIVVFGRSGTAISLGWQVRGLGNVLLLVYTLTAAIYAVGVARGLQQRIEFSVEPIGISQRVLLAGLILVVCGSLYLGCASDIQRDGFSPPESAIEMFMGQMERQIVARVPVEQREVAVSRFREEFRRGVTDFFEHTVEPYEQYIPLVVAASFFITLIQISSLLLWVPTLILMSGAFSLLKLLGLAKVVTETLEVRRLVLS